MTALVALAMTLPRHSDTVPADVRRMAVLGRLRTMRIDVNFQRESLRDVLSYLAEYTGPHFLIDPSVEDPRSMPVTVQIKGVRILSLLKLIPSEHDLAAVDREGHIAIMPRSRTPTS